VPVPDDVATIAELIIDDGPNQSNYLSEDDIRQNEGKIVTRATRAVLAVDEDRIIGVITFERGRHFPEYQPIGREDSITGYVAEAVVARDRVGRGIGSTLLEAAIAQLTSDGDVREVYAIRHSDNLPSERMMEKCGMVHIDEFDHPEIRLNGSRRSVVTRFMVEA